uniref:Uncharacterized protein n=1 Tax=Knipowitschia caucasica TaxID=637954 RepID=A0AAV2IUT5_KNICA
MWAALLSALAHLAAAEKSYHNMTFLGQKMGGQSFFSRKDSIRTIYTSLHNELRKVVTMSRHTQPSSSSFLEDLLSHLSEQLCHFTQARIEMADMYEKMLSLGAQKNINLEELVTTLEAVLHKYSSKFHHPIVGRLEEGERPLTHWPNVIMMMGDRAAELNTLEKVVHFYDDKVQSTYYLTRPEPHFTLVVIFDGRKSEKELYITAFLLEISASLRVSKPFSTLKPGSKG